jgi:SAM-dependent methyltransferase
VADLRPATSLSRRIIRRAKYVLKPLLRNYWTIRLQIMWRRPRRPLVLHLGCGEAHINGAVNIDVRNTGAVDVVCDLTRLPYRLGSVDRIETYHVVEHLPRAELAAALAHWHGILREDGLVIIECPDFDLAIQDYQSGNEARLGNIFGLQRFATDFHYWGWNSRRLAALLRQVGFDRIEERPAADYHTETEPCLRLEARKPRGESA